MKRLQSTLVSLLFQAVLIVCLYFSCVKNIHGCANIAIFLAWFNFIGSFILILAARDEKFRDKMKFQAIKWVVTPIDVFILGVFLFYGFIFTAIIWCLSIFFEYIAKGIVKDKKNEQTTTV